MIINDLYVSWPNGALIVPSEANPVLIVDADTVLAGAITNEGFQSVPWRRA
jgi:hypothetical protein